MRFKFRKKIDQEIKKIINNLHFLNEWCKTEKKPTLIISLKENAIGILILIITIIIVNLFFHEYEIEGHIIISVLLIISAILVNVIFIVAKMGNKLNKCIINLSTIHNILSEKSYGKALLNVFSHNIEGWQKIADEIETDGGIILDAENLRLLTKACFSGIKSNYYAIDSNLPSKFEKMYPDYLKYHKIMLDQFDIHDSTRIISAYNNELMEDANKDESGSHQEFITWHEDNKVGLYEINPDILDGIKNNDKYKYLPTTDVGIWENQFSLFFQPTEKDNVRVWMYSIENNKEKFNTSVEYFKEVKNNAEPLGKTVRIINKELSARWQEYVDCDKRTENELPIILDNLRNLLNDDAIILDSACGIGCELKFFSKHGYRIIPNEIDEELCKIAEKSILPKGFLNAKCNWKDISHRYDENFFDCILCLGNSLCLISRKKEQIKVLKEFFMILRPKGILVIDVRNFDYMIRNKSSILENPVHNFHPNSETVMYHGKTIKGTPVKIEESAVKFVCYEPQNIENPNQIFDMGNKTILGHFNLYPIRKNSDYDELGELLEEAGYNIIKILSDFHDDFNPDAKFYTYFAEKPDN